MKNQNTVLVHSVRPNCPACGHPFLTGELVRKDKDPSGGFTTHCNYPDCGAIVYLDGSWNVLYAERRYYPKKQGG